MNRNLNINGKLDRGQSRVVPTKEIEVWVSMVAAVPPATRNKKGRICSTRIAIQMSEQCVSCETIIFQLPTGKLKVSTANRWLQSPRIRKDRKFK